MSHTDNLGDRMKADYENRTRYYLPRRTYTLLRVDGKSFHTFTKGYDRPFDMHLMACMDRAAQALCGQIEGARLAYVQSDEITVLLTDFGTPHTEAWFDGNLQKIASVAASIATASFNQAINTRRVLALRDAARDDPAALDALTDACVAAPQAVFDCRVWQIPQRIEVFNAFLWRQQDATKNAISMTAHAHFSHNALQNKSGGEMQEMLWQERGINFNDLPTGFKRGRVIEKVLYQTDVTYTDKRTGETRVAQGVERSEWRIIADAPLFSSEAGRPWLLARLPDNG